MAEWDRTSPNAWARAIGMVAVPLFGVSRLSAGVGSHHILLDGPKASFALSVGDADSLRANSALLSWSWSSNITHSLIVDPDRARLFRRRWDKPDDIEESTLPDMDAAIHAVNELTKASGPTQETVIARMLHIFWALRRNIEERGGSDIDLIRTFNVLLLWAELIQQDEAIRLSPDRPSQLREILPILAARKSADISQDLNTRGSILSFHIGEFAERVLEADPATGVILNPHLFIRHASGALYEAAHIALARQPLSGHTQLMLPMPIVSLDESPPSGAPNRDVHYTPASLARALVQEAIREMRNIRTLPKRLRVLDPACGSGVFLIEALREINAGLDCGVKLFGIDSSPISCIMSTFCLSRSLSDDRPHRSSFQIVSKNSLRMKHWDSPDLILMNPPFKAWGDMKPEERAIVKKVLGTKRYGRLVDTSSAFVAKALDTLKPGGVLATIVPASLLESNAALQLRTSIQDDRSLSIRLIAKFRSLSYFQGAQVEPALLVIAKLAQAPTLERSPVRFLLAEDKHEDEAIRGLRRGDMTGSIAVEGWEIFDVKPEEISPASWLPVAQAPTKFLRSLADSGIATVSKLFKVHQGIQTGANDVFMVDSAELEHFASDKPFNDFFRPVADEIRDGIIRESSYVFYPYSSLGELLVEDEESLKLLVPTFFRERLDPNRLKLAKRPAVLEKPWWCLNRHRPEWQAGALPKLLSTKYGRRGSFAYDASGRFVVLQGLAWIWKGEDFHARDLPWAYYALLNSQLFESIVAQICPRVQGGQFNIYRQYIRKVPLPDLSDERYVPSDLLASLVTMGRCLASGQLSNLEALDSLVASAYGASLPQIKVMLSPEAAERTKREFRALAEAWKNETAHFSNLRRIRKHPAYQRIVEMGEGAIPLILDELKRDPAHWFSALMEITGENPVSKSNLGRTAEMAREWIEWGRRKGHVV